MMTSMLVYFFGTISHQNYYTFYLKNIYKFQERYQSYEINIFRNKRILYPMIQKSCISNELTYMINCWLKHNPQ